jgi:hypothetical protein
MFGQVVLFVLCFFAARFLQVCLYRVKNYKIEEERATGRGVAFGGHHFCAKVVCEFHFEQNHRFFTLYILTHILICGLCGHEVHVSGINDYRKGGRVTYRSNVYSSVGAVFALSYT